MAAMAPSLCLVGYGMLTNIGDEKIIDSMPFAVVIYCIAFAVSLIPTLALGLPFVLWLRSRDRLNALNICLGAVVTGALFAALFSWATVRGSPFPEASTFWLGGALGLAGGFAFCVGARLGKSMPACPLRPKANV